MTEDVLFIVCITKIKDNLRIMNEFKQLLLKRKHLFSYRCNVHDVLSLSRTPK